MCLSRVAALVAAAALAFAPAIVHADDFSDFRIPDNGFLQWNTVLDASANGNRHHSGATHENYSFADLGWTMRLVRLRDSEARYSDWTWLANASGSRRSTSAATGPFRNVLGYDTEDSDRRMFEGLSASTSQRFYPGEAARYVGGSVGAAFQDQQEWTADQEVDRYQPPGLLEAAEWRATETKLYDSEVAASLALGWGRTRNATGVYEALLFEDRLRNSGAITRALTRTGREKLAALFYGRTSIEAAHDLPATGFWDSLDRILKEDGALREGGISPADVIHLTEPVVGAARGLLSTSTDIPRSPFVRLCGQFLQLSISGQSDHAVSHRAAAFSNRQIYDLPLTAYSSIDSRGITRNDHNSVAVDASGEFHRPLSLRTQFDAGASCSLPLRKEDRGYRSSASASLAHCVSERWLAMATVRYQQRLLRDRADETLDDSWSLTLGAAAHYFLADRTTLDGAFTQRWSRETRYLLFGGFGSGNDFGNSTHLSFGLTYRFAGYAEIPDLYPVSTLQ